jgi:hypothetical protein
MRVGSFISMRQKDAIGNEFVSGQSSLYNYFQLGSSLSVRSFTRFGSTFSMLRHTHVGSSVSLRAFYRSGSNGAVSSIDFANIGSNISVRSFVRLGSRLSIGGVMRIGQGYIFYDSSDSDKVKFYASSALQPSMHLSTSGSKLHGTWTSEVAISSDRRLKQDIEPLLKDIMNLSKLHSMQSSTGARERVKTSINQSQSHNTNTGLPLNDSQVVDIKLSKSDDSFASSASKPNQPFGLASKLIRQLRPVSFRYKTSSEAKYSRYGFIAQELETLVPSVVHSEDLSGLKFVRYHDLLAILALGIQGIDSAIQISAQNIDSLMKRTSNDFAFVHSRLRSFEDALVLLLESTVSQDKIVYRGSTHTSNSHLTLLADRKNASHTYDMHVYTHSVRTTINDGSLNATRLETNDLSHVDDMRDIFTIDVSNPLKVSTILNTSSPIAEQSYNNETDDRDAYLPLQKSKDRNDLLDELFALVEK